MDVGNEGTVPKKVKQRKPPALKEKLDAKQGQKVIASATENLWKQYFNLVKFLEENFTDHVVNNRHLSAIQLATILLNAQKVKAEEAEPGSDEAGEGETVGGRKPLVEASCSPEADSETASSDQH